MPTHPCPICTTLTAGTATEGGLRFDCCPECLAAPVAELQAMQSEVERTRAWVCRVCGCTDQRACLGGCAWADPNLCSRCAAAEVCR